MRLRDKLYFFKGNSGTKVTRGAGTCNTIVLGNKKMLLIDPGESVGKCMTSLKRRMAKDGVNIQDVQLMLFTHVHFDHANAAGFVQKESNCEVRTHPHDVASIENQVVEYDRVMLPIMKLKEFPQVPFSIARFFLNLYIGKRLPAKTSQALTDGEVITIDDLTLEVIFTPGHAVGHVAYYIPEYKALIAGDTIDREMDGAIGAGGCVNNMESSWEDLLHTLHVLERYDVEIYLPGHGNPIEGKKLVKDFITRNIAASIAKPQAIFECIPNDGSNLKGILHRVYPNLPFTLSHVKKIEVFLMLQYLTRLQEVVVTTTRQGHFWMRKK